MSEASAISAKATRLCPRCGAHGATADCASCGTPTIAIPGGADDPGSLVGTVLGGKYAVQGVLGHGGMGTVYRGEQALVERQVAIKVMRAESAADGDAVKRFEREAKLTSRLSHPNSIHLFDFGLTDDGLMYLVMELLNGKELADDIKERGSLDVQRALHISAQVAHALRAAHALGIVHRDLKPGNIFLAQQVDGTEIVKVMDFGIAKSLNDDGAAQVTQAGVVVGTPAYMSPEQAKGGQLTANSDIYALGIILYEMLTGAVPFHSESLVSVLMMHVGRQPPPLREQRPDLAHHTALQDALNALLDKAPDKRPDAAATVALLSAVGAGTPAAAVNPADAVDVNEATAFVEAMADAPAAAAVRVEAGGDVDEATAFMEAMSGPADAVDVDEATAFVDAMPATAVRVEAGGDEDEATAFVDSVAEPPTRREVPRPARPVPGRRAPRSAAVKPTPARAAAAQASALHEATVTTRAATEADEATVTAMGAAEVAQPARKGGLPPAAKQGGIPPAVFGIAAVGGVLTIGVALAAWLMFSGGSDSPEPPPASVVEEAAPETKPAEIEARPAEIEAKPAPKPAPKPSPAAPPAAAESAANKVRVISEPPGASVAVEGLQIGHTPMTIDRPSKGTGVDIVLKLAGHRDQKVRLGHSHKGDLSVTLSKSAAAHRRKARKRRKRRRSKREEAGLDMMME